MIRTIALILHALLFALLIGCGAGQWKTTTTYGGKTTVRGDAETMRQEAAKQKSTAELQRRIRAAKPRTANEAIRVAILPPTFSDKLKLRAKGNEVLESLRKEFGERPQIRLVDHKALPQERDGNNGFTGTRPLIADIVIQTHLYQEESYGLNRRTGKVEAYPALVLKGQVQSNWLSEEKFTHKERDHILLSKKLFKQYSVVLVDKIKAEFHLPGGAFREALQKENANTFDSFLEKLRSGQ